MTTVDIVQLYKDSAKTQPIAPKTDIKAVYNEGTPFIDFVYPVGSIYMTIDGSFDPNASWGGTWIPVADRFLIGASTNYPVESLGGEASHTLTVAEIPNHRHNIITTNATGTIANPGTMLRQNGSDSYAVTGGSGYTAVQSTDIGSGTAHNNMPPYYSVYMWKRTA